MKRLGRILFPPPPSVCQEKQLRRQGYMVAFVCSENGLTDGRWEVKSKCVGRKSKRRTVVPPPLFNVVEHCAHGTSSRIDPPKKYCVGVGLNNIEEGGKKGEGLLACQSIFSSNRRIDATSILLSIVGPLIRLFRQTTMQCLRCVYS